jgi:hypothetical protein
MKNYVLALLMVLCIAGLAFAKSTPAPEYAKAGFVTFLEDGRLWILKEGSKDLADFQKNGELAKFVVIPGGGPKGMTVKSPDKEIIEEYMAK